MTIEEKIKQAAESHAKDSLPLYNAYFHDDENTRKGRFVAEKSFIAGANFGREIGMKEAFEWRDVNIELPEAIKDSKSLPVLIKTKYGGYDVAVYDNYFSDFIANAMAVAGVTHWRPINLEDMP